MTQPPSPSAEALVEADEILKWCAIDHEPWRRKPLALHFDAFAAQAVAAERAKPTASDYEAAELLRRELELLGIDTHRNIADSRVPDILAAALAERGERERDAWMSCARVDALMNGPRLKGWNVVYLNRLWEERAAAIRNEPLTGD